MSNNQCKNCGSRLSFDVESQMLKCSHCDSHVAINNIKSLNSKLEFSNKSLENYSKEKNTQYKCLRCGNIHIANGNQTIIVCPSCGAREFSQTVDVNVEPDGIAPFKITKDKAGEIFKQWLNKRLFAPNNLKKLAKLKKVSGLYYPIWNYDFVDTFEYSGVGVTYSKDKNGRESSSHSYFRDKIVTKNKDYFVNANNVISQHYIEKLGEFNLDKLYQFTPEYMYGWIGLCSDIKLQDSYANLKGFVQHRNEANIKSKLRLRYDDIDNFRSSTQFNNVYYNYIYIPIWANHFDYKGKLFHCYINGTTGKATGKAPISTIKVTLTVLLVIAILTAIALLAH